MQAGKDCEGAMRPYYYIIVISRRRRISGGAARERRRTEMNTARSNE